ncbi:MAG: hypothetical protein WAU07_02060 [Microgenomates group bacterium]
MKKKDEFTRDKVNNDENLIPSELVPFLIFLKMEANARRIEYHQQRYILNNEVVAAILTAMDYFCTEHNQKPYLYFSPDNDIAIQTLLAQNVAALNRVDAPITHTFERITEEDLFGARGLYRYVTVTDCRPVLRSMDLNGAQWEAYFLILFKPIEPTAESLSTQPQGTYTIAYILKENQAI